MIELYGKKYSKMELLERVCDINQIAGAVPSTLSDGRGAGMNIIDVKTGSGLKFTVNTDRGMDIGRAEYKGIPFSFVSKTGLCSPFLYNSYKDEFLRNFYGGLLTTCGLLSTGAPSVVDNREFVMHGRISNIPSYDVCIDNDWVGDDFKINIAGKVRQSKLYEENIVLKRRIHTSLGSKKIGIEDQVENQDSKPEDLMILYHFNFGFPFLSEDSIMMTSEGEVSPRDEVAAGRIECCKEMTVPQSDWPETVFFHKPDKTEYAFSVLFNPELSENGLGVYVKYKPDQLPYLIEWKQMGKGDYVLAMEPGTYPPVGRARAKEDNGLVTIAPGEILEYKLEIGIVESLEDAEALLD